MKNALRLVAANVGLWIVLELVALGVLSAVTPEITSTQDRDTDWIVQTRLSFQGGLYVWDPHCFWRLAPAYRGRDDAGSRRFWGDEVLITNSHGMRSPEIAVAKPHGTQRILVLGGSHPMGMYVSAKQTYASQLQTKLNTHGSQWEVLNASVPGYTTFQGLRYLAHYGAEFSPDIVIFDLGVNDKLPLTTDFSVADHQITQPSRWVAGLHYVFEWSAVYRLLRHVITGPGHEVGGVRVPAATHAENLKAVARLGQTRGFKVLYMSQVRVDLHASGAVQCQFREEAVEPKVDICRLMETQGKTVVQLFADPIHANAKGHALIAGSVFEKLRALGWIKSDDK